MADKTLELCITQEQYDILNDLYANHDARRKLETFNATGNLANLDIVWLRSAANIYSFIYNAQKPNIHCITCITAFVKPLLHQIHLYEQTNGLTTNY